MCGEMAELVEGARLEIVYGRNVIKGSNPFLSATKNNTLLVVQLRDTQSRKNIGIVGMYLPAMPIFLYLLRLAA